MRSNAWTIFRINASIRGNKLIYWLGRLPLLRRLFTDRLYAAGEGKFALFLLQNLWWALRAVVGKAIYLAALLLIAAFLALDGAGDTLSPANLGPFCWIFLWMSFFIGTLLQPHAVAPSQLKYICVRMMAMDAWRYQMITGLGHHLAAFAGFTPLLMVVTALLGAGPWAGLVVSLELAFVRLAAEGLHLFLYSRTGASVGGKVWYIMLMFIAGTAVVGFPFLVRTVLGLSAELYGASESVLGAAAVLGALAAGIFGPRLKRWERLVGAFGLALLPAGAGFAARLGPTALYLLLTCGLFAGQFVCSMFSVLALSHIQQRTPEHLTGKVTALTMTLSTCAQPLGQLLYGQFFDLAGSTPEYVLLPTAAALCLLPRALPTPKPTA